MWPNNLCLKDILQMVIETIKFGKYLCKMLEEQERLPVQESKIIMTKNLLNAKKD